MLMRNCHLQPKSSTLSSISINLPRSKIRRLEDAEQCCFLCLQIGPQNQVAVCLRPTTYREEVGEILDLESGKYFVEYAELKPAEMAVECDANIYERIKHTCLRKHSQWKMWLPFYGIKKVEEVKVRST